MLLLLLLLGATERYMWMQDGCSLRRLYPAGTVVGHTQVRSLAVFTV